jgi:hypothetical protein
MNKRRVFVMTDISSLETKKGEPDDTQSLVRLLLYAGEIDLTGFAATYTVHTEGVNPDFIRRVIGCYGEVYKNLLRHDPDFPSAEKLLSGVYKGIVEPGRDKIGKESEAARQIVSIADASEEVLWILAWGGVTDLAMALDLAKKEKTKDEMALFISKLRVYSIGDQYDDCGSWIRENFPALFYITSFRCHRGMYRCGDTGLCSPRWIKENLAGSPLIGAYPIYDGGDIYGSFFGKVEGLKEGDTPSFLYLIDHGPGEGEHPEYGGWGGRFVNRPGSRHFFDAADYYDGIFSEWASVFRYRPDVQADFALRSRWCLPDSPVEPYLNLRISAPVKILEAGKVIELKAETDPAAAGDVRYSWSWYPEAGTYRSGLFFADADKQVCKIMPDRMISRGGNAHIICRAAAGSPARVSYRRLILPIKKR